MYLWVCASNCMNAFSFSPVTALFNQFLTCQEFVAYVLCVFRGRSNIHSKTLKECNDNTGKALRYKNRSMVALHLLFFMLPMRTSVIRAHATINPCSHLHLSSTALIKRMKEKKNARRCTGADVYLYSRSLYCYCYVHFYRAALACLIVYKRLLLLHCLHGVLK